MNKKYVYTIILIAIIVSCIAGLIFASRDCDNDVKDKEPKENIHIKLLGEENVVILVGEEFIDEGAIVMIEGVETNEKYETLGEVDVDTPGEYIILYKYKEYESKRTVNVKDTTPPVITLKGSREITIAEGTKYEEFGYTAIDNMEGDITDRVVVEGEVGTKIGSYGLTYSVSDADENVGSATRVVKVVKKKTVQQVKTDEKADDKKPTVFSNEISSMEYSKEGIQIVGEYSKDVKSISLVETLGLRKYDYTLTKTGKNYAGYLDLSKLANGVYELYLIGEDFTEKAVNKLPNLYRIKRVKIGNKLVTFDYNSNNVQVSVQNFAYEYDILIDVGHGGIDPGAVNSTHLEKDLNLTVSKYEEKRYKEHGLKVLLTRSGDSLELKKGDLDWRELSQRVYAMGYYGVVSKIVYSNHHNSFGTKGRMGPEIIVPSKLTKAELAPELKIMDLWTTFTPLTENHVRFYTRDYNKETIHTKANGEVYTFMNYYAVNRVPYELFNVKAVIFEPAYMSNKANFQWYWLEENWVKMSEMKIKTYVEYLGLTYKEPK